MAPLFPLPAASPDANSDGFPAPPEEWPPAPPGPPIPPTMLKPIKLEKRRGGGGVGWGSGRSSSSHSKAASPPKSGSKPPKLDSKPKPVPAPAPKKPVPASKPAPAAAPQKEPSWNNMNGLPIVPPEKPKGKPYPHLPPKPSKPESRGGNVLFIPSFNPKPGSIPGYKPNHFRPNKLPTEPSTPRHDAHGEMPSLGSCNQRCGIITGVTIAALAFLALLLLVVRQSMKKRARNSQTSKENKDADTKEHSKPARVNPFTLFKRFSSRKAARNQNRSEEDGIQLVGPQTLDPRNTSVSDTSTIKPVKVPVVNIEAPSPSPVPSYDPPSYSQSEENKNLPTDIMLASGIQNPEHIENLKHELGSGSDSRAHPSEGKPETDMADLGASFRQSLTSKNSSRSSGSDEKAIVNFWRTFSKSRDEEEEEDIAIERLENREGDGVRHPCSGLMKGKRKE